MDPLKINKPFHIKCQNCGKDISVNAKKIKKDYDKAREEVVIIEAKLATERHKNGKSNYYRKLIKDLEDAKTKVMKSKNQWNAICDRGEHELFVMFKRKLFRKYGKEEIIKIIEECEEEMFYHENEFMKQNHNNFNGA